jgi:hypothetical protein
MKTKEVISEISLGNYRDKALKQKAQSQMGAMFAKDPEERKKNLSTFNKREKGLNRLKARDEKSRKAAADKDMSDTIAQLPKLKDEYEQMKAKYKSLGGSNWQYADREQNLTDREREARGMEGPMNNLWRRINAAEKAQKSESANISERVTPEWIEVNRKAKELLAKGMTVDQVAKQLGVQGPNNGMTGSMGGLWGAINAAKQQMGNAKMGTVAEGLDEGRSDYVGDAIEGLRMAKPGLEKEDFLDELYSYIDAEMGNRAAEAAFADKGSYDDWYDSYSDAMDENANMLKVAKDDDKQTILQNPSTGVQTQIDKTNPNAPRLTQDEQGKLKLAAPMGAGGQQQQQQQKPTLVGKDVEVATESAALTAMLKIAGLR